MSSNEPINFECRRRPGSTVADYAAAYNEVKTLGGDGVVTPTDPHGGANADRHLLGLRWNAEFVRAAAGSTIKLDHADRAQDGHG